MKTHEEEEAERKNTKGFKITSVVFAVIALLSYLGGNIGLGNFTIVIYLFYCLNRFVLYKAIGNFQNKNLAFSAGKI
jgi:hypothetical protein